MIRILIWGIGGKMGRNILECVSNDQELQVVGGVDKFANPSDFSVPVFTCGEKINVQADVVIDFSRPEALNDLLKYATINKVNAVIATTGYSHEQEQQIVNASKDIAIFKTSNFSLGVNLMIQLCKKASAFLGENYDIEIIEQHHNLKVDSPSGTALSIANAINEEFDNEKDFVYGRHSKTQRREQKEIGIHAVRGGTIVGKHDVLFIGKDEIITIAHEAQSKMVFANGAVRAAKYLASQKNGMRDMKDLLANVLD